MLLCKSTLTNVGFLTLKCTDKHHNNTGGRIESYIYGTWPDHKNTHRVIHKDKTPSG